MIRLSSLGVACGLMASVFAISTSAQAQAYIQAEGGFDSLSVDGNKINGAAYGAAAGYDYQLGPDLFVGGEIGIGRGTGSDCAPPSFNYGANDLDQCIKKGRDIDAFLRIGTRVGERTKLYALGGYTNTRIRQNYFTCFYIKGCSISEELVSANLNGFRLGAGLSYDLNKNVFVSVEYRYSKYEPNRSIYWDLPDAKSDFSRSNAIAGMGIKF